MGPAIPTGQCCPIFALASSPGQVSPAGGPEEAGGQPAPGGWTGRRAGGRAEGREGTSVTHVGRSVLSCPVRRSTMVAGTRCLLALLLPQVLLGGAAGLIPELGRRRFAAASQASSASRPSDDVLSEFELRLLGMFGLKQRPTPSRDAVVPPYMLDLYRRHSGQPGAPALDHRLERAASRANTVRSFHHEGKWGHGRGCCGRGGRLGPKAPRGARKGYRGPLAFPGLQEPFGGRLECPDSLCSWHGSQGFPLGNSAPALAARQRRDSSLPSPGMERCGVMENMRAQALPLVS